MQNSQIYRHRKEVEWRLPGAGGEGEMGGCCLMGMECQFCKVKGGRGQVVTDLQDMTDLISLNFILKMGKMANFVLCVIYHS